MTSPSFEPGPELAGIACAGSVLVCISVASEGLSSNEFRLFSGGLSLLYVAGLAYGALIHQLGLNRHGIKSLTLAAGIAGLTAHLGMANVHPLLSASAASLLVMSTAPIWALILGQTQSRSLAMFFSFSCLMAAAAGAQVLEITQRANYGLWAIAAVHAITCALALRRHQGESLRPGLSRTLRPRAVAGPIGAGLCFAGTILLRAASSHSTFSGPLHSERALVPMLCIGLLAMAPAATGGRQRLGTTRMHWGLCALAAWWVLEIGGLGPRQFATAPDWLKALPLLFALGFIVYFPLRRATLVALMTGILLSGPPPSAPTITPASRPQSRGARAHLLKPAAPPATGRRSVAPPMAKAPRDQLASSLPRIPTEPRWKTGGSLPPG